MRGKQSERGEAFLEELRQVSTKGYERTEVKKRIKYICIALEKFGERIPTYTSWKKWNAADGGYENFQVQISSAT